jgi:hypothetical protein
MKFLYLFLLSFPFQVALAQKTVLSVNLNGGLSSFRGASAVGSQDIYTGGIFCNCSPSPASSFGAKSAFAYGAGLTIQRELRSRVLIGLDAGYEVAGSKIAVNQYVMDDMVMPTQGKSVSYNHFINLFPHIGYRIPVAENVKVSIAAGTDFGIGLSSYSKLKIPEYFKERIRESNDRIPGLDFRPRIQFQVSYRKVGLYVSYSHGLTNWMGDWVGGNPEAYLKVFRLGVQYQLN